MGNNIGLVLVAVAVVSVSWLWGAVVYLVWRPYAAGKALGRQGVRGPAYKFYVGSNDEVRAMKAATDDLVLDLHSHDFIPRVLPHYRKWMSLYGKVFLLWFGSKPTLCVADPYMVKQILSNRTGLYRKPDPGPNIMALLGKGLVFTEGDDWVRHRRVVHPAFTIDKLKMMTKTLAECALATIRTWEARALSNGERRVQVEVGQQFQELTADVISHTAFGSSYREGKEVFLTQRELQFLAVTTMNSVYVPALKYVPTKRNVYRWGLEKKVKNTLMRIIKERVAAAASRGEKGYGNDLLGLMLEANASSTAEGQSIISMNEIIDECKTFFFAGHDTTAHLLTWAVFLLGTHPEWQDRLREEVLRECGRREVPTGDTLSKLKLVTMVLYETLRLYGAVSMIARTAGTDTELGSLNVPKGTVLTIPVAIMHRDKDVWGADANEFNPARFQHGVGKAAKHPNALLSFSAGPRSCIGQDFAMLEAKAMTAMILQRFSFEVSPEYVHAPTDFLTLQPKFGLPVVLKYLGA